MPSTRRTPFAALAVLASVFAAPAAADDLTTSGGKKLTGKLVAVGADGTTFSTGEASVKVSAKDIVLIDLGNKVAAVPAGTRYSELELTDGSTFRLGKFLVKGKKFEVEPAAGPAGVPAPAIDLPLGAVFSVMRGAEDPKNHEAWKKILANRGKRDMYVIREADGLNFVQGTVLNGNEAGDLLNFEKEDGTTADLRLSRATGGLVFSQPTPAQVPPTLCRVLDVFGNALTARAVEISASGVAVTTVSGVVVRYPSTASLSKLDYARGNVAYLSDLDPRVDAPEVPADEKGLRFNLAVPFLKDRTLSNDGLRLGTDTFAKGLWVAQDTALTFNVGGDYRELKAVVGIDEAGANGTSEAKVTVEADGRIVFAEVVRRKDKPRQLGLDIKGVKQIRLIVEADTPVNGNFVILGEARVEK